jgi:Protein of unknown function (DUF3501)
VKPIERGEILGLAEYEHVREHFRTRVIANKKLRRIRVGENVSAVFESRDTVLLQIQEMLRTERITRASAIDHEIDTYNELLPSGDELSCTLMIEIADKEPRERFLREGVGFQQHVWLVVSSARIAARPIERDPGPSDRTTAVHYLKFGLPAHVADALRGTAANPTDLTIVEMLVDHPAYQARALLSPQTVRELGEDLRS